MTQVRQAMENVHEATERAAQDLTALGTKLLVLVSGNRRVTRGGG